MKPPSASTHDMIDQFDRRLCTIARVFDSAPTAYSNDDMYGHISLTRTPCADAIASARFPYLENRGKSVAGNEVTRLHVPPNFLHAHRTRKPMSNSNVWQHSGANIEHRGPPSDGIQPIQAHWTDTLRDGTPVMIRPIADTDIEIERRFIERLSPSSRRFRFLGEMKTPSEQLLRQFTHLDHATEAAFVALVGDGSDKEEIGVSRYSARTDGLGCECAVAVSDEWQRRGLGTILMQHLIDVARQRGIATMYSMDAADNVAMRDLAEHLGFQRSSDPNDATQVIHMLDLNAAVA
jgi:GNAT superfamily N-acetyltransferase